MSADLRRLRAENEDLRTRLAKAQADVKTIARQRDDALTAKTGYAKVALAAHDSLTVVLAGIAAKYDAAIDTERTAVTDRIIDESHQRVDSLPPK